MHGPGGQQAGPGLEIDSCPVSTIPLPFFRCYFAVTISQPLPFSYTVAVAAAVAYLFAVYGCNGTEFSYVTFTEFYNVRTAKRQRKKGNGMVETGHQSNGSVRAEKYGLSRINLRLRLEFRIFKHRSSLNICIMA